MSADTQGAEQNLEHRRRAEEWRAQAAEHRARAHELRARAQLGEEGSGFGSDAYLHAGIEEVLADVAELRAEEFGLRADAVVALARAEGVDPAQREERLREAGDAVLRAVALEQRAGALTAGLEAEAEVHEAAARAERSPAAGAAEPSPAAAPARQADPDPV